MNQNQAYFLQNLYCKIRNNNYKEKPEYSNDSFINNPKISKNNFMLLVKLSNLASFSLISPLEILYKQQYEKLNHVTNESEKCSICQCEFYDDIVQYNDNKSLVLKNFNDYFNHEIDTIKLSKCQDHFFHIECLLNYVQNKKGFKCPNCQKIYGIIVGNMPPGKFWVKVSDNLHCAGFNNDGTIILNYQFDSGKDYSGTRRTCYLPNNVKGREILAMLKIAFDRKLTFVVGTSVTTGQKNTVVWNGIHHKTNLTGGPTKYGYPDDKYFNRVEEELAARGVFRREGLEEMALSIMYGNF